MIRKACGDRIEMNVQERFFEFITVSNDPIKRSSLPESSTFLAGCLDTFGGRCFDFPNDGTKRVVVCRGQEQMKMIRHHGVRKEQESAALAGTANRVEDRLVFGGCERQGRR